MPVVQRKAWIFITLLIVVLIAALSLGFSRLLASVPVILGTPGLWIDFLALGFLMFMMWCTTRVSLTQFSVLPIRCGLLLWIAGNGFDLMDEIVVQPRWVGYYCEDLLRLSGMFITATGVYRIIRKINLLYVDARTRSLHDELTQLPNRRFFIDTIREKMQQPAPLALMILDIDFFKKINDTWGHMTGDETLFSLGKMLSALADNPHISAARIGGEEFAIIVQGADYQTVNGLAQTILRRAATIMVNNTQPLSVSIGVGFRHPQEGQEGFIKKVDEALYAAKHNGRGRIEWAR